MAERVFDEEKYIVGMFDRGVVGFPEGGLVLKSGRVTPYYHNMRPLLSHDQRRARNGSMSVEQQRDLIRNTVAGYAQRFIEINAQFDHVFGKAQAATAPMAVAAYEAGMSYLWERVPDPSKLHYGAHQELIEGNYEDGQLVHLGDDNTTNGASKIEGADVLLKVGLQAVSLTVGFDREEDARANLEALGYEMNAVTSLSRAVPVLRDHGRIDNGHVEAVIAYHEDLRQEGIDTTFSLDG